MTKVKNTQSPIFKQYSDLKKKHPEALLLFRCGDFYETYDKDAEDASKILGITLTKSSKIGIYLAGFPYTSLDTYLPKLIRAGKRVAICDQISVPNTDGLAKREVTDIVSPGTANETEQNTQINNNTNSNTTTTMEKTIKNKSFINERNYYIIKNGEFVNVIIDEIQMFDNVTDYRYKTETVFKETDGEIITAYKSRSDYEHNNPIQRRELIELNAKINKSNTAFKKDEDGYVYVEAYEFKDGHPQVGNYYPFGVTKSMMVSSIDLLFHEEVYAKRAECVAWNKAIFKDENGEEISGGYMQDAKITTKQQLAIASLKVAINKCKEAGIEFIVNHRTGKLTAYNGETYHIEEDNGYDMYNTDLLLTNIVDTAQMYEDCFYGLVKNKKD